MTIGEKIRELREKNGISKGQLSRDLGIGRGAVLAWERGDNFPSLLYACDIADYFNISLDELVGRKTE